MAALTVWRYATPGGADHAAKVLKGLVAQRAVVIHDAATVGWDMGQPKPRTRQIDDFTAAGALSGVFWGLLFGQIFFVPLLGAALGAATGAVSGSLTDLGIDDTFINRIRDEVTPGTSALFLLSPDDVVDKVSGALDGPPSPELLSSSLSADQERALLEVFSH